VNFWAWSLRRSRWVRWESCWGDGAGKLEEDFGVFGQEAFGRAGVKLAQGAMDLHGHGYFRWLRRDGVLRNSRAGLITELGIFAFGAFVEPLKVSRLLPAADVLEHSQK